MNENNMIKKSLTSRLPSKVLSDLYSIAAFLYTPVDMVVKGCRTFRRRQLLNPEHEALYQRAQFKNYLSKILSGSGSIMKDRLLKATALLSTLVLQTISFFTTLAGVTYYFSSVSPYAPLAFAFTIQFLFYIMSNFGSGRVKFSIPRRLMLSLVFMISMLFSYIGIVNEYVPPIKTFEEKYNAYYTIYDSVYQEAIDSFKKDLVSPGDQLKLLFQNVQTLCTQADVEIAGYQDMVSGLSGIKETVRTGRNEWGYTTYESNPAYESAQQEKRNYTALMNQLKTSKEQLMASHANLTADQSFNQALEDYLQNAQLSSELARFNNEFIHFSTAYNQLLSALQTQMFEPVTYDLVSLADQYRSNNSFLSLSMADFNELQSAMGEQQELYSNDYFFLLSDMIEEEVQGKYEKFRLAVKDMLPDFNSQLLTEKYHALIPLPDINLVALEKLLPSSPYFQQGMVALFLALLVDGMTAVIPVLINNRPVSCLRAGHSKRLPYTEEETMEKIILSVSSLLPPASDYETAVTSEQFGPRYVNYGISKDMAQHHLTGCIHILAGYFSLFHSSPWTNAQGYSKYLSEEALTRQGCNAYCHITDILCSLKYLTVVSEHEYQLLIHDAQNLKDVTGSINSGEIPGDTIYLMKKHFDLWMSENLAGLLQLES